MYVTFLELKSLMFLVILVVVGLILNTSYYFSAIAGCYALVIILHSSNYLSIRFQKLFQEIQKLHSCEGYEDQVLRSGNQAVILEKTSVKDWIERARRRVRKRNWILDEAENVLNEVQLHNQVVKDILHSSVTLYGPCIRSSA